jgi:hypothetical protein
MGELIFFYENLNPIWLYQLKKLGIKSIILKMSMHTQKSKGNPITEIQMAVLLWCS